MRNKSRVNSRFMSIVLTIALLAMFTFTTACEQDAVDKLQLKNDKLSEQVAVLTATINGDKDHNGLTKNLKMTNDLASTADGNATTALELLKSIEEESASNVADADVGKCWQLAFSSDEMPILGCVLYARLSPNMPRGSHWTHVAAKLETWAPKTGTPSQQAAGENAKFDAENAALREQVRTLIVKAYGHVKWTGNVSGQNVNGQVIGAMSDKDLLAFAFRPASRLDIMATTFDIERRHTPKKAPAKVFKAKEPCPDGNPAY